MKRSRSNIFVALALLIMAVTTVSKAETWESVKKKEINQSFQVNKSSLLFVDNRYGNMTIAHWDKSEALIRVEIESAASSEQASQQNLDRVKIDLRKNGDKISAITTIEAQKISGSTNQRLTINYYISIPSTMNIELSQRYGSIVLPAKNEGESLLTVKYGSISGGSFTKGLNLDAKYSNINIGDVVNATLSLGYCGTAVVGDSKQLEIDSKYSTLKIGNSDMLNMDAKYGKLTAENIKNAQLSMKYSEATAGKIKDELLVESLDYSTLKIKELDSMFKRVAVEAHYGTLDIRIATDAAFRIEAENVRDNLNISGLKETKHDIENKTNHFVEINGGSSRKISFDGNRYSNLRISTK